MKSRCVSGCTLVTLLLLSCGSHVWARLVKGPYLENVGPDHITVSWESDELTDGHLLYGMGELKEEIAIPEGSGVQSVTIENLKPDKTYFYRLELYDGSFSPTLTFSTAPAGSRPFRFVVVGDTRTDHPMHREVSGLIGELAPDFYINTGDLVEDGDNADMWQTFFDIEHALMSKMVMWPVMGNHDHRDGTLYDVLFNVDSESGNSRYYSFDYSNCHFTVINSDEDFSPSSQQYQWVDADLAAASSDPDIEHIFVFYHRPPFSSGWHGSEGLPLAEHLHPLVSRHGVEIVFNGHDHDYERSTVDEVLYIVTGGGGAPYPPLLEEDQAPNPDNNPYGQIFFGVFHAVECTVQDTEVRCEMIDLTRTVRDTFGVNVSEDENGEEQECEPCKTGCSSTEGTSTVLAILVLMIVAVRVSRRQRRGR